MTTTSFIKDTIKHGLVDWYASRSWPTYDGKLLDRDKFLTASEATKCDRELVANKTTEPAQYDPDDMGMMLRGHVVEEAVVTALTAMLTDKIELHFAGDLQVSFYSDKYGLSATPDGILYDRENDVAYNLEIKSIDPRASVNNLPRNQHVTQVKLGAFLINECWQNEKYRIGAASHITKSIIVYVNASDLCNIHAYEVDSYLEGDVDLMKIVSKADSIRRAVADGHDFNHVVAPGAALGQCKWCRVNGCTARNTGAPATIKGVFNTKPVAPNGATKVDSLLSTYSTLKRAADAAADRLKPVKEEVIQTIIMEGDEVSEKKRRIEGSKFDAVLTTIAGRMTWDKEKLEEALGEDVSSYQKQGAPSLRLDVLDLGSE